MPIPPPQFICHRIRVHCDVMLHRDGNLGMALWRACSVSCAAVWNSCSCEASNAVSGTCAGHAANCTNTTAGCRRPCVTREWSRRLMRANARCGTQSSVWRKLSFGTQSARGSRLWRRLHITSTRIVTTPSAPEPEKNPCHPNGSGSSGIGSGSRSADTVVLTPRMRFRQLALTRSARTTFCGYCSGFRLRSAIRLPLSTLGGPSTSGTAVGAAVGARPPCNRAIRSATCGCRLSRCSER
jgi:hypothetical protein